MTPPAPVPGPRPMRRIVVLSPEFQRDRAALKKAYDAEKGENGGTRTGEPFSPRALEYVQLQRSLMALRFHSDQRLLGDYPGSKPLGLQNTDLRDFSELKVPVWVDKGHEDQPSHRLFFQEFQNPHGLRVENGRVTGDSSAAPVVVVHGFLHRQGKRGPDGRPHAPAADQIATRLGRSIHGRPEQQLSAVAAQRGNLDTTIVHSRRPLEPEVVLPLPEAYKAAFDAAIAPAGQAPHGNPAAPPNDRPPGQATRPGRSADRDR